MKKEKKKRRPNKTFSGPVDESPMEIQILDDGDELQFIFSFNNRALKMMKSGRTLEKTFLKDSKQCRMMLVVVPLLVIDT